MKTKAPGLSVGIILGTICLVAGLALWVWEPNFAGFFNRGHDASTMPIWTLLLILAVINFAYGFLSMYIQRRANQMNVDALEPPREAGKG